MRLVVLLLLSLPGMVLHCQEVDSIFSPFGIIELDSVVVKAAADGFDAEDFINYITKDESFYRAFKNIRSVSYSSNHNMQFYDKKGIERDWYKSRVIHSVKDHCQSMVMEEETFSEKFIKRKKTRYYSFKMMERLFYTKGSRCIDKKPVSKISIKEVKEGHVGSLKRLIFSPGSKLSLPFIGKKAAIFEPRMARFYRYNIREANYLDSPCYAFEVLLKPDYDDPKSGKTVIRQMITYFSKKDFQILGRLQHMRYHGAVVKFDVKMDIQLFLKTDTYFPKAISFNGYFNVPFKKYERSTLTINFFDYK